MNKKVFALTILLSLCSCSSVSSTSETRMLNITFKNYDDTVLYETSVKYGEDAVYEGETPTKEKNEKYTYTFNGWNKSLYNIKMDTTFIATYKAVTNTYKVVWTNYDDSILEVDENVPYGTLPTFDSKTPTRDNDGINTFSFDSWDKRVEEVTQDVTYKATYKLNVLKGSKVTFGSYPQSKVNDVNLIKELLPLAGELPSATKLNDWTSYKYYQLDKNDVDFMFYKDIEKDNNKFRAVYFTSYRPYFTNKDGSDASTVMDNNGYLVNTTYFFKYEPITWNVLDDSGLLFSDTILDAEQFYHSASKYKVDNVLYNTNNYKMSDIRSFLNDRFYHDAFNNIEKEKITKSLVKNDLTSTLDDDNDYICEDTNDYIYLLSNKEYKEYLKERTLRVSRASDYAYCMGLKIDKNNEASYYWSRSPYYKNSYQSYCMNNLGELSKYNVYSVMNGGIRPALRLNDIK